MNGLNQWLFSQPLYWIMVIGGVTVIIIYYLFFPKIIGWFGELWTKQELNKLPKDKYVVLNDIFIKINNQTHQIDHVVISQYGIFCIETKQYNGYITGSKYDKQWVRHVGKKKIYYTNPIRQNYGHIKALAELLNINQSKIFNLVCIPSRARINIKDEGEVVRNSTIVNKILSHNNIIISDINSIVDAIINNNIFDKHIKKEHIRNIKKNIIDKDNSKCPKCGGQLLERNSKYGRFIGCSNYPKCKYTRLKL